MAEEKKEVFKTNEQASHETLLKTNLELDMKTCRITSGKIYEKTVFDENDIGESNTEVRYLYHN